MDWKTEYAGKRTTAAEALECVKSGDRVVFAHACGEPLDLVDALVARAGELERVEINHMVAMGKGEYCKPEYADAFYHKSLFVGASSREAVKDGRGDYIPVFFHEIPKLFCEGYLHAGRRAHPGVAARQARLLLVRHLRRLHQAGGPGREDRGRPGQPQDAAHPRRRLHPRLARSTSSSRATRTSSSCSRRGSAPSRRPSASTSPASSTTAPACSSASAASPTRCSLFLHEKNDLGIHSEMFSEGVVDLYNEGVITNSAQDRTTPTRWSPRSSWARGASTTSSTTTPSSTCSR